MNICLLKCGNVLPEHLPISGDYEDMFAALFQKYAPSIKLTVFNLQKGDYPENLNKFDGFLSTGSPDSVYDKTAWIEAYKNFVIKLYTEKHKHVGICFGHQMIAEALGGKVQKSNSGWGIGIKTYQLNSNPAWLNVDKLKHFTLIVSHQDQVCKLPPNSEVIAGNDHCPVGMFTVGDLALGIQPHPEFTKEYDIASINSPKSIITPELVEAALKSMEQKTDSAVVAKWIENFFKNGI